MTANVAGDERIMTALTLGVAAGTCALESFGSALASVLLGGLIVVAAWVAGAVLKECVRTRFVAANDNAIREPSTGHPF